MNEKTMSTTLNVTMSPWKHWANEELLGWYRYMVRIGERDLAEILGLEAFDRGLI